MQVYAHLSKFRRIREDMSGVAVPRQSRARRVAGLRTQLLGGGMPGASASELAPASGGASVAALRRRHFAGVGRAGVASIE